MKSEYKSVLDDGDGDWVRVISTGQEGQVEFIGANPEYPWIRFYDTGVLRPVYTRDLKLLATPLEVLVG